ncbi:unnamed protein product [Acanthosepion pharaonis]|uniref:Uncharacterized protein n=1 Tax=Acanthosepion pharaonis TaxID=158019 RepID=A0A812B6E4_ACAPH|nr:unnamed protein product [Sepia pharaonis]
MAAFKAIFFLHLIPFLPEDSQTLSLCWWLIWPNLISFLFLLSPICSLSSPLLCSLLCSPLLLSSYPSLSFSLSLPSVFPFSSISLFVLFFLFSDTFSFFFSRTISFSHILYFLSPLLALSPFPTLFFLLSLCFSEIKSFSLSLPLSFWTLPFLILFSSPLTISFISQLPVSNFLYSLLSLCISHLYFPLSHLVSHLSFYTSLLIFFSFFFSISFSLNPFLLSPTDSL